MEIVHQLSCLVAMTAELCYGTVPMVTNSFSLETMPLKVSVLATKLSHRVQGTRNYSLLF